VSAGGPLLVVDTATTVAVVALGTPGGALVEARDWVAGYRHGEELLTRIEGLLRDHGLAPGDLGGLIVGTGPGAFTGLRVGIATVKGLAYALGLPVAGRSTGESLLAAAVEAAGTNHVALIQPAGPSDLVLSRADQVPRIVVGGAELGLEPGERLAAVDLGGRAPDEAVTLGDTARAGLARRLLSAGALTLQDGGGDDLARLVPEYVTLPRGVLAQPPDDGVAVTDDVARQPAAGAQASR
jgi:tRNA threonylcarbamoyl adenosine modification protein YeaZ